MQFALRALVARVHRAAVDVHSLRILVRCSLFVHLSRMTRDPCRPFFCASWPVCVHTGIVQLSSFAGLPDALTVEDLGHSVRCTGCGRQGGASAHPHHRLWIAHLRQTGQRHRLPYWTSFMPEEDDKKVLAAFQVQGEFLSS